jgi:hypothetical protein
MILTSALILWKGLVVVTGSESPVVVVLSGSMEPGFRKVHSSFHSVSTPLPSFISSYTINMVCCTRRGSEVCDR